MEVTVQQPYPGIQEIHRKAGFRICAYQKGEVCSPLNRIVPRAFSFYSLTHLIRGKGWYWTPDGGYEYLTAGQGIISSPGFVQSYGGFNSVFVEDYICFEGSVADNLFRSGVIRDGILNIGKDRRLLPFIKWAEDPSDSGQLRANGEFYKFLTDLYLENREQALDLPPHNSIQRLISAINEDLHTWWRVEEMAEYCSLSVNHFRNLFKIQTGLRPREYVEKLKMQRAAELLSGSSRTISSIAAYLGYSDRFHFSKVFKKEKGCSPRDFRKNFSISQPGRDQ